MAQLEVGLFLGAVGPRGPLGLGQGVGGVLGVGEAKVFRAEVFVGTWPSGVVRVAQLEVGL